MDDQLAVRRQGSLPDQRREEILDAAVRLFAQHGYRDTTIADIAREIGMGHGVFYRHFTGKRDILAAIVERVVGEVLGVLRGAGGGPARTAAEYRRQLESIVSGLYAIWDANPALRIMLLRADAIDGEFQARFRSTYGLVVTLICGPLQCGMEAGFLPADLDAVATAEALVGLLLGGAMREAFPRGPGDRERYVAAALRLMFDGLGGGRAADTLTSVGARSR
jgi:AcrR family transcriptional regulator